jgi:hypothetical protein
MGFQLLAFHHTDTHIWVLYLLALAVPIHNKQQIFKRTWFEFDSSHTSRSGYPSGLGFSLSDSFMTPKLVYTSSL